MKTNSFLPWLLGSKSETGSLSKGEEFQSKDFKQQPLSTQINYDSALIQKLKADHVELFRLFNEINAVSEREEYASLPELLASFRLALQTHLMLESVKFYAYIQQHIAKDVELSSFVDNVKKEMDGIAHAIMRFINNHKTQIAIEENAVIFKEELKEIGDILVKRISVEETRLYTLYKATY